MDALTRQIAEFAHKLNYVDIPSGVVKAARHRALDSIGCALGGSACEAADMGRRLARGGAPEMYAGRIVGIHERTTAETATFINTTMIRYLDFNDGHHGGHPSDMIGALLALAESSGAGGQRLLSAIVVAYEVALRFIRGSTFREKGWDQGFAIGIGTAAGVGHLLGLPAERIGHAIAITCVANVPMRATRAGELSLWKGAATAYACRNAVFATLLAAEGMTSPDKSFEGRHGLFDQITGPFELAPFPDAGGSYILLQTFLKYWPVEANTQAAVWAALQLREKMLIEDIESIDFATYWSAWHETASEPEKWDPKTRETADHSMPFIFARAFLDGGMTPESFSDEAIADPRMKPLMAKITARLDDAIEVTYQAAYPNTFALHVNVKGRGGRSERIELVNPRGMPQNPMDDGEIANKFRIQAEPVLGAERSAKAAAVWGNIDTDKDLSAAMDILAF
ncbi:MAG: MmgE/PrpD family protein [Rhodospirillales bacterium]|jgi:2-methylcitrate dehydratase